MGKTTPARWWDLGRYEDECHEYDMRDVVEQTAIAGALNPDWIEDQIGWH